MKYFFFLLLVANVIFYLWETGVGREKADVQRIDISLPDNTEKIVLVTELPAVPIKSMTTPALTPVPTLPTVAAATEEKASPTSETPTPVPASAENEPMISDCFLLGPFASDAAAQNANVTIHDKVESTELVSREGDIADGFWVLYPKAESIEAARINRKMLIEKGIKDVWVFDKGELAGAISLGLFKTRERAEIAQKRFFEQNIAVEVKPRLTHAPAHWVQIRQAADRTHLENTLLEALSNRSSSLEIKLKPCD